MLLLLWYRVDSPEPAPPFSYDHVGRWFQPWDHLDPQRLPEGLRLGIPKPYPLFLEPASLS
jgi:hypothetical protein